MGRVLASLAAALVASLSLAADGRVEGASFFVNEVRVHVFVASHGKATAGDRAKSAAAAAQALAADSGVMVQRAGASWRVKAGGRVVLVVNPSDAKAGRTSGQALANAVADRLAFALSLPPLAASVSKIESPLGKVSVVQLTGSAARKAVLTNSNKDVLSVRREHGKLIVTATGLGSSKLKATFGEALVEVPVAVLPYAFDSGRVFEAQVVGSPADSSVVAGAAAATVQTWPQTPEANRVWIKVLDPRPLARGKSTHLKVRVKAIGPGCLPFEGDVTVKVSNVGEDLPREDQLWYSNEPEQVEKPGRLYWAELASGKTARLLYHHQSAYSLPQVVRYMVANPTEKDASVAIALGDSRPDKNPTRAGYVAGDQFLVKWLSRSAEVVRVPARTVVPITVRQLRFGETCSGVATINLRSGGAERLVVIGDSVMSEALYQDWTAGQGVIGAWHTVRPRQLETVRFSLDGQGAGVFPEPFKEERLDYEVGGRFGFTRIGEVPITNATDNTSLPGNFGVIYNINGTLRNGTTAPAEVEVLFETSAGFGSGLFVLNGELVRVGLIQPKQEIVLASIKLPAGSQKPISIQTMPLSGANYPVTLIVRPTGLEQTAVLRR